MRSTLPLLAALLALGTTAAQAQDGYPRRLAHRPLAAGLPPETPYVDPRPRFRPLPPGPRMGAPVAVSVAPGYQPRPTNHPIYNEPPQPLR